MNARALSLLHYVSLDGAGGVELQCADFVTRAAELRGARSQIVACGRGVHPLVAERLPADTVIGREKYLGAFKLPKQPAALRRQRQRRFVQRAVPDAVIIWNRLRDSLATLAAAGPECCIYWERGAAWFAESTPAKTRFLAEVPAALCNSHAARRMLELRWGYRGQTRVVPNALRPALAPTNEPARDTPSTPWRLGIAARLEPIKGVAIALHALAALRQQGHDVGLEIAGDGPERAALTALADRLGMADAVVFHGLVADMAAFYRRIDVLVHPALREPFGQIVIEAAAYGVPTIASAVDGLVEVVADGETGITLTPEQPLTAYAALGGGTDGLPPYVYHPAVDTIAEPRVVAPEALAAAIASLLGRPARYAAYSAAGQARVASVFSFDRHVERALTAVRGFVEHGRLDSDHAGGAI